MTSGMLEFAERIDPSNSDVLASKLWELAREVRDIVQLLREVSLKWNPVMT